MLQPLLDAARKMLDQAYAPYSDFHVGAAILTEKGNIFTGCNVENASYGLTICAERGAVMTAVAAEGPQMKIKAVAVVNSKDMPCSPCGACRQVMFEFGPEAVVVFQGKDGMMSSTMKELLPAGFEL